MRLAQRACLNEALMRAFRDGSTSIRSPPLRQHRFITEQRDAGERRACSPRRQAFGESRDEHLSVQHPGEQHVDITGVEIAPEHRHDVVFSELSCGFRDGPGTNAPDVIAVEPSTGIELVEELPRDTRFAHAWWASDEDELTQ